MRSSADLSRIDPTTSRCTRLPSEGSSGATSSVTMARVASWASRSISPCPISPPAPVINTADLRTPLPQQENAVDYRRDDRQHGQDETTDRDHEVIDPFGFEWIEQASGDKSAGEAAGMRPVVDAAHEKTHHEHRDGPRPGLTADNARPRSAAVVHQRAEQSHDGGRCAQRLRGPDEAAQQKTRDARDRVDDDHPPGAVKLGDRGSELPNPEQIEPDVQQAAVEPRRAERRPPAMQQKNRPVPGRAENGRDLVRGGKKIQNISARREHAGP